ncbi:hypothetical protein BH10PLA1_BH10PLA1_07850 [soil metagenome]
MNRAWMPLLGGVLGLMVAVSGVATADPAVAPVDPAAAPPTTTMPSAVPALTGRPDETPSTQPVLGEKFISQSGGISLRPPAGCVTIRRAGSDTIAEFVNEEKKINLRVTRTSFSKPVKLTIPADKPGVTINGEKDKGLLEMTASQLQLRMPSSKILRQDLLPLANHDGAVVILRGTSGVQREFIQQAIIQSSEQLYFNIILTTPGQDYTTAADKPDASELAAANLFRAVLDTVDLLDLEKLRADQDDRLFRTRSLFVNWTEAKIRSVLIPEQWMRVLRDGKDVGYSYIVEEGETRGTNPGVKIGIRSRTVPQTGRQVDAETWYHVSFDRKLENWSSIVLFTGGGEEAYHATEFGSSEARRKPVVDRRALSEAPVDERHAKGDNVGMKLVDVYTLSVHRVTKKVTAPDIERDLPPFYLAQGLGHLLPRLMPTNEPRGYLFASYVSSETEVKLRYVDVGLPTDVTLDGQKLHVIPISDRIGYDATPTIHYMDLNGRYAGSVTTFIDEAGKKSTITILPTDQATLQSLWTNATLTRPQEDPHVPIK